MSAPRKALGFKKTEPLAATTHLLEDLRKLAALDAALQKEGKESLMEGDEARVLASARLALTAMRVRLLRQQKERAPSPPPP